MVGEREFHPSIVGRLLDVTTNSGSLVPADLVIEYFRVNGPYIKVLRGKISDPQKVEQITNRYTECYRKLQSSVHPGRD